MYPPQVGSVRVAGARKTVTRPSGAAKERRAQRRSHRMNGRAMPIDKAILLSAGKGSRLLPLTAERPKCLIELGPDPARMAARRARRGGVGEIVVVTGFRADLVEAVVARGRERRARPSSIPSTMSPTISARCGWRAASWTATSCCSTATRWSRRLWSPAVLARRGGADRRHGRPQGQPTTPTT